ncbi:ATP-dependent RNA helicase DBP3 [Beauveria bassiana]|uniref:RNA helicase n=1 Tax=Beauveria bassiana (strain ARSEF 2860) TaxID=655819 RepID=J4W2V4_BEAB2|nr:DEAD/DEAH box helicase [Beauveria bassiana ARSEF 2860]EJP64755.1 DEAD/DEAH box helicase [Beauveria bassiana ARSEF 2860]KAF1733325.1 ATP-dependent RNA helicase DBP3 [Beauveria bassiana]KAH8712604.1 ATP-dependent RNA helicase DBP3 [Beauveria bassiana]
MAATKHSIADSEEASRPVKKSKTVHNEGVSEMVRLRQERKEKKEQKREKKKARKEAKKKLNVAKHAKKQAQEDSEPVVDEKEEEEKETSEPKKEKKEKKETSEPKKEKKEKKETAEPKKEKKEKKNKAASAPAPSSANGYEQTAALNGVAQADIDAFLETEQITITDPKSSEATLRPILDFAHLPPTDLLTKKGSPFANYKAPTPIQAASWPFTLSGRDVVGVAETGSGKTMAFALPCVKAVAAIGKRGTKAVIVSPTRELAMQTHEQLAALATLAGLSCVCLYGGSSKDEQRALINRGADIIVATPGRLKDFMSDDTVDLSGCQFAVLDEADRMLDKGFEDDIKQILGSCPPRENRQTLMFTATWPFSVQTLASTFMVEPVKITIGCGGKETENGAVELQANTRITQRVEVLDGKDKEFRLLQVLKQAQQGSKKNDRILVFCLYKKEATRVENFLSRKGIRVGGIHGDLRQEQRTKALESFKLGHTPVLVATDVAARGLDIPEVKLVVNVTFPLTIEDYVHRIGRTGRAGKTGDAITFFTAQDKAHSGSLVNILKGANQPVPDELLKFGTTVKKKTHDMYGSFFKDVDMNQKATKITFD